MKVLKKNEGNEGRGHGGLQRELDPQVWGGPVLIKMRRILTRDGLFQEKLFKHDQFYGWALWPAS